MRSRTHTFVYLKQHNTLALSYYQPKGDSTIAQMHKKSSISYYNDIYFVSSPFTLIISEGSVESPHIFVDVNYDWGIYFPLVRDYL